TRVAAMQDGGRVKPHGSGGRRVRRLDAADQLLLELLKPGGAKAWILDIGGEDLQLGFKILRRGLAAEGKGIVAHAETHAIGLSGKGDGHFGGRQGAQSAL